MDGLKMKYFVLKPKGKSPYAQASRDAMNAYAKAIATENPQLCKDLRKWAANEHRENILGEDENDSPRRS